MLPLTRDAGLQGTQTKGVSFKSQITALEAQLVIAAQYDNTKTEVVENTMQLLTSPALTGAKFGFNSQMYIDHLSSYMSSGGQLKTWGFPLTEPAGAAAASGTVTFTVVTPVAGNLVFYIKAWRFVVGITATDTAETAAAKVVAVINGAKYVGCTAANVAGVITITVSWKGVSGNDFRFHFGPWKTDDPKIPSGVTIVEVQPTGGVGAEDTTLAALWTIMLSSSEWRTLVVQPSNSSTAMTDAYNAIGLPEDGTSQGSGLWSDGNYRPCTNLTGSIETDLGTIAAIGDARKHDPNNIICCSPDAMELPSEIAAAVAGVIGRSANANAATKYAGTDVSPYLKGALDLDNDWTRDPANANVETALDAGLTVITTNDNGFTTLLDVVTTYHPDGVVKPMEQYEVNKYKTWNMALTLINDKLVFKNDVIVESTEEASSQPMAVDEDMITGRAVSLAIGWAKFGWAFNSAFTIANMEITLSEINPDRYDRKLPVLLSGNKRVESDTVYVDRNTSLAGESVTIVG